MYYSLVSIYVTIHVPGVLMYTGSLVVIYIVIHALDVLIGTGYMDVLTSVEYLVLEVLYI